MNILTFVHTHSIPFHFYIVFLVPPSISSDFSIASRCTDYYEVCNYTRLFILRRNFSKVNHSNVLVSSQRPHNYNYNNRNTKLKPMTISVDLIGDMLRPTQYNGADEEAERPLDEQNALTRQQLEERVQASASELRAALQGLGVVELRGKMRMLSRVAVREVSRALLDTVMEHGWPLDEVEEEACRQAMPATDSVLLLHALSVLGAPRGGGGGGGGSAVTGSGGGSGGGGGGGNHMVWSLSPEKVAKATARILFSAQAQPLVSSSF